MFDPISLGLGALSVGNGLFGMFSRKGRIDPGLANAANVLEMQNSVLEEKRMHLDATRRRRDIIRQAQVATAVAENTAANGGALNSSSAEGARASISGQAGVNTLGVSQNEEIASNMIMNKRLQGAVNFQMQGQRGRSPGIAEGIGGIINGREEELSRLLKWGLNIK